MEKLIQKEDLEMLVPPFLEKIKPSSGATIILLQGDLGAGKTTFTQVLARALGFSGTVISPTFVIQKRYPISFKGYKNLIHIDAYRLEDPYEIKKLGWDEWVSDSTNIIVVEWPEKIKEVLPKEKYRIILTHVSETIRSINISHET